MNSNIGEQMKLDSRFKNIDYSESLVDYAQEKLQALQKHQMKEINLHMTVYRKGHYKLVDLNVLSSETSYKSTGRSDDFYVSIDLAMAKIKKQMHKKKAKIKNHKNMSLAKLGVLDSEEYSSYGDEDYVDYEDVG